MITSVDFVLRHCCPPLATIEHENRSISNFLGPPPSLLLSEVCRSGTVEMLDWVWAASCTRVEERVQGWFLPNYLRSDPHYYRWQYVKSLYAAAERGDVEIVEWVFAHFSGCEAPFDVVKAAAREGHLHVLRVLCKHRDTSNSADADESSFAGHAFCKTPCTVKFKDGYLDEYYGDTVISKSIDNGEFVECLNDGMVLGCWDRRSAIKYALRIGNIELAERLLPAGECILKYGAGCPHPEVIKMMVDAGHERWTEYRATVALIDLAKTGNVELMQLLFQLYSPLREDQESWSKAWREALTAACKCGSLAVLQWLSEHDLGQQEYDGLKTESDTWIHNYQLLCAASHGHVDVMQYLYGKGLVTDRPEYAIEETIRKGHIEAVKWFVDHGFFNDQRHFGLAIAKAAEYGHLELLQLFHEMDGPGGYETVGLKRRPSNESFRLWGSAKDTLLRAAAGGHVHVLEWLQANHPEECDTDVMDVAAGRGRLAALKLLHANRNEGCSTDAMIGAAEYGHFETVRWLYENRPESHTCAAIGKAIRGGHLRIAYWLLKKFPDYRVRAFSGEPLRLMNDSIYSSRKPLETLLYLRVVYPESLTPRFIRTIREDYEDSHPDRTTSKIILSWLNDDFPSTKATVA